MLGFPSLKIDDIQERFHTFGNFPFCKTLLNNFTITRLIDEELHLINSLRIKYIKCKPRWFQRKL
jgi:hypothetical protein